MPSRTVAAASGGTRQGQLGKGWPLGGDRAVLNEAVREHLARKVAFGQKSEEKREQLVVAVCR